MRRKDRVNKGIAHNLVNWSEPLSLYFSRYLQDLERMKLERQVFKITVTIKIGDAPEESQTQTWMK